MSNEATQDKGNILWRLSKKFQFAAESIIPDSFVFCIILAFLIFILGIIACGSPIQMVESWYNGFWTQSTFAFQMTIMVVVCAAFAQAPAIRKGLDGLASIGKTPRGAMVVLMIVGFIASFINWAFCTIICPILAMRMAKKVKGLHFPMMLAAGYSTMILGQCMGPSASVYALLAGEGHFLEDLIGVLPQSETTYNPMNVCLWIIIAVVTVILAVLTTPPAHEVVEFHGTIEDEDIVEEKTEKKTPADAMNGSKILMYATGVLGLVYIIYSFVTKGIMNSLGLNFIIFLFITLNCFVYNSPRKFITAIKSSMYLATDVMIQFPFYGAIMQMMQDSGLAQIIIDALASVASPRTVPMFTYISACIVNLFIPSQGGQWVVQGPIMVPLAQKFNIYIPNIVNAFCYGDEATNLLQPLYLIPALAVVNVPLKKVWGYCAYIFVVWFIITCLGLYFLPPLFTMYAA